MVKGAWAASLAALLAVQGGRAAWAQTTHTTGYGSTGELPDPNANAPRFGRLREHSLGWRFWVVNIPAWEVGLFSHVAPGWSGPIGIATGPEYVERNRDHDIVLSLFYADFSTHATPPIPGSGDMGDNIGWIHGTNEADTDTEGVWSSMYGIFFSATILFKAPITDWLEFQYGAGAGLGFIGGDLYREQAYQVPGGYSLCSGPGNPSAAYCANPNDHFPSPTDGSPHAENTWFNGGSRPPIMPWFDLPALALHIRPHRNFDIRLDFGWAIWNFHGGLAAHYVF